MLEKQKEYKATKEELEDYDRIITKINQGKVVQIRKALNDYDKKFPNSPYLHNLYWGFINISQDLKSLGYFEVNKEHRELFRSYINKLDLLTQKLAALTIYQKLFDLKLNLYCEESFTSTDDVKVNFNLKKLNKVNFKVYKIYLEESLLPLERVPVSGVTLDKNNLIKEFERTFNKDYEGFISLGKFDSGIYVVFAESEGLISGTYIKVSNMGVIAKADSKKMVFFVYDKISGKPLKDVIIPVFSGFNLYGYGKTDENGIALMLKRQKDKNLSFRVAFHKDGDLTFLRSHFYYNYNETYRSGCTSYKVYFYTDRPIYRPDQKVFFKCIVREQRNVLSYSVPKNLSVRLKIISSKGKIVYNKVLECNGFGTINGEFELLEDADLGIYSYQISSETRNKYLPYINGSAFWVEEYKKPEFEVKLIPDKDHYIKGDYVTINMNASYYFGGPVQDSEVEYKISYRKLFPFDSLSNSDNYRLANKTSAFKEVILKEGKIQTDSEGKCKIKFKTLDLDYSSIYIIETKLTDSSRRVVENTVKIKVDLVGFSILVRTDKRIYDPGEKIKIYYSGIKSGNKTKEFSGNLILGRYIWADDKVTFKIIKTDEIKSSGKIIPYIATINEPGNYLVKITSKDVDGNQISGEIGFYICNKQLEENFKFKTLKLISDKDKYKYNETARLIIESPKKETYAFITFEGKDIINYKVVPILSNISYFEYKLLKAYRPEISCSINLAKDKILYNYSKKIEIYPDEGILNIKIKTNKKIYKPGEEVEILIDVTDANGNPVKTELSLGVVDSSVFYFRSGFNTDIKKFFSRHRRIQPWVLNFKENIMFNKRKNTMPVTSFFAVVETLPGVIRVGDQLHIRGGRGDQVNYMVDGISITDPVTGTFGGTLNENSIQSMNLMASGFSAEYGEAIQGLHLPVPVGDLVSEVNVIVPNLFIKPELRGYFPDTALWIPDLVTDREGFAKVTFKIPDTLTEWKISSIGITKDTKAGMEFIKIKTTKNILVRLETPRFLTQRDSLTISGIVHNYLTTAKLVKGKLISENIEMKTSEQKSTTIQPNKSFRFNWEVFAKESGEATFTLEGLTNEDSDAMRLKIPILPFGIKENTSINGKINDKTDQLEIIDIPETAQLDSLEVIINISNGSLPTEMFDSLEYLIGYPYGCIEQTMSRFLPTLITIRTLKRFGLENKKIELKVPDMVTKGIQRLEQMQHSDGGWGWWQHDKTHPYMTAYVVYGLNIAIKEGYKVPQNVYRNGVRSLKEQFHKSETNDTFVYMGYVISGLGHVDNFSREKILKLFHNRQKISAFGEPLLAIALMNINEVNKAKEIMDSISVKAIFDQKKRECYFSGRAFEYSWRKNDLEITANCLRAFAKIDPFDEKVQLVINWLINKKNNGNWGDTKNSANVIFAFAEYVGNKSALASEFKYSVFVNDKEMLNEKINNKDLEGSNRKLILDGKTIKHGKNQIHIVKKGKDKLFYNISIKYYNEATSIPEKSKNVSVKRNYKLVKENNDINNGTIASGVEFEVELEISSKDKLEYLMIEDYIPAGCEIVNRKSGRSKYHWIAHQEFRDEKAVFFITKFQGKKTIKYKLRAEIPGTYNVLPTIVTSMYFPEVYANSNSYKLKIIE